VEVLSAIARWMQLKMDGNSDPTPDMLSFKGRAKSLGQYKKALLYCLRNLNSDTWNDQSQEGNATRSSAQVNNLIKRVKKAEICKLGKRSAA
jgi:hypothetical protein